MESLSSDIILCGAKDSEYMIEFLQSLSRGRTPIHLFTKATAPFTDASKRYVCVRRIPWWLIPRGAKVVFVNTEQLTAPQKLAEYKTFVEDKRGWSNLAVLDYSRENIEIAGRGEYLPVQENPSETKLLRSFMRAAPEKTYDVAVVGTPTERRLQIVRELQNAGISVDFINNAFGTKRDRRVAACKALVNLHATPDYNLYEPLRCERWRHAGMPVVSEPCLDAIPAGVAVVPFENNIDAAVRILRSLFGQNT